jgi:hypothetical protein
MLKQVQHDSSMDRPRIANAIQAMTLCGVMGL